MTGYIGFWITAFALAILGTILSIVLFKNVPALREKVDPLDAALFGIKHKK